MRLLVLSLVLAAVAVSGRLTADSVDFDIQGLELLEQRYGSAYPGFAGMGAGGKVDLNQQLGTTLLGSNVGVNPLLGNVGINTASWGNIGGQQFGMGAEEQFGMGNMPLGMDMSNIGMQQGVLSPVQLQSMLGSVGTAPIVGGGLMPPQPLSLGQYQQQLSTATMAGNVGLGNVGMSNIGMESGFGSGSWSNVGLGSSLGSLNLGSSFGGLGAGMGSKKGQTTVAQPIYAESLIVPKVITQPILRPHMVTQPIVQQQLIQQPIVETRQVVQPVIRRIITQPIIKPQILESTTIQPTLKTETTVQPHLIEQTIVTPQLQTVAMENQPIQEKPTTQMQQAVIQPTQSGKKSSFSTRTF